MKPEQQRIKIAEACGWKWHSRTKGSIKVWDNGLDYVFYDSQLPDYLNDLNAMHEAEKVLTKEQRIDHMEWLGMCSDDYGQKVWAYVHATAAQRADAFLRTIEKWATPTQPEQTKL